MVFLSLNIIGRIIFSSKLPILNTTIIFFLLPEMMNLTTRLCWKFVKKDGYIAIWQKPTNNTCYLNRDSGVKPPLCDVDDDPDKVWYVYIYPHLF